MNKKIIIAIIVVILLLIAGGIWWNIQRNQKPSETASPIDQNAISTVKMSTWDDPLGFTFQYPEGIVIDKHDEDQENYAHVELTQKDHPGKLIVWAKDTTAIDVSAWVKTEKQFAGGSVIDTTMGGVPAKKILLLDSNSLYVGAIADELLFLIDVTLDDREYWTSVAQTVLDSFVFKETLIGKAQTVTSAVGNDTVEESSVDEEEVVE